MPGLQFVSRYGYATRTGDTMNLQSNRLAIDKAGIWNLPANFHLFSPEDSQSSMHSFRGRFHTTDIGIYHTIGFGMQSSAQKCE
jgi:hypothetical protein